jgi:hypothetical protein
MLMRCTSAKPATIVREIVEIRINMDGRERIARRTIERNGHEPIVRVYDPPVSRAHLPSLRTMLREQDQ